MRRSGSIDEYSGRKPDNRQKHSRKGVPDGVFDLTQTVPLQSRIATKPQVYDVVTQPPDQRLSVYRNEQPKKHDHNKELLEYDIQVDVTPRQLQKEKQRYAQTQEEYHNISSHYLSLLSCDSSSTLSTAALRNLLTNAETLLLKLHKDIRSLESEKSRYTHELSEIRRVCSDDPLLHASVERYMSLRATIDRLHSSYRNSQQSIRQVNDECARDRAVHSDRMKKLNARVSQARVLSEAEADAVQVCRLRSPYMFLTNV
jgi:chromosome segregation ATPase